jgi:hypothetical protein
LGVSTIAVDIAASFREISTEQIKRTWRAACLCRTADAIDKT